MILTGFRVILCSSEVYHNTGFIPYNPSIMPRWNYCSISWSTLNLRTIIHYYLNSAGDNISCVRSFTAICFYNWFDTFLPAPTWFERTSSNCNTTISKSYCLYLSLSKDLTSSGEFRLLPTNFPVDDMLIKL
jgi:hypothetical protein